MYICYDIFLFFVNRRNAVTMKNMLETAFPGVNIVLGNQPPEFSKGLASKMVPIFQVGIIGIILGGEQIFPRMGISTPPPLYYSLRANRFGSITAIWFLGNFLQSYLQTTGAFEAYCNGKLVSVCFYFFSFNYFFALKFFTFSFGNGRFSPS